MKILAFETLSSAVSTALMVDTKITSYNISSDKTKQSEILVSEIERILKENNLWYHDLDWIACSSGPASFTGTRIALACARSIRIATKIPLILMNSCEIIAHKYYGYKGEIISLIQANSEEFFFARSGQEPQLVTKENLANVLPKTKFLLCGSGKKAAAQIIANPQFEMTEEEDEIRANLIVSLALQKINNGEVKEAIEPIYLRSPNITQRKK